MPPRRKTRQVDVGGVRIGGDAPVALQTMTAGHTHEVDACIAEVQKLARAGADLVRVAVPEKRDTEALLRERRMVILSAPFHVSGLQLGRAERCACFRIKP